ncbi:hypothetical protein L9F63_001996, partial [Diploptera punctata]
VVFICLLIKTYSVSEIIKFFEIKAVEYELHRIAFSISRNPKRLARSRQTKRSKRPLFPYYLCNCKFNMLKEIILKIFCHKLLRFI